MQKDGFYEHIYRACIQQILSTVAHSINVGTRRDLRDYRQCAKKRLKMIGFEPDERSFSKLEQSDLLKCLNIALWDKL